MTGHGQFQPPAQGQAVDRGDDRDGRPLDAPEQLTQAAEAVTHGLSVRHEAHIGEVLDHHQVRPGRKAALARPDHQAPQFIASPLEGNLQVFHHLFGKDVEWTLGHIQRGDAYPVVADLQCDVVHGTCGSAL